MTIRRWVVTLAFLVVGALPGLATPATADSLCKPAAPLPQSKCNKDAQCCPGLVCQASSDDETRCQAGCRIGGRLFGAGALDPDNACQSCQPGVSTTAWTNVANGTACDDGNACTANDVCAGGACSSTAFDCAPPRIVASSLQESDLASAGLLTYVATFSKPMAVANLDGSDITLGNSTLGGSYTPASASYDATGTVLTLTYADLPDDSYTLTLLSGDGRFEDPGGSDLDGEAVAWPIPPNVTGDGVAGGDFVLHFALDVGVAPFPTPLTPEEPLGSLVYDPPKTGVIAPAGDTDSYTLDVDAGQTLTIVVTPFPPASTLQPTVEASNPGAVLIGSATAAAGGVSALLQSVYASEAGTYTIAVGGANGTTGGYNLRVILNAAVETESLFSGDTNDTLATAQDLDTAFMTPAAPAQHAAVLGGNEMTGATWSDDYSFSASAGQRWTFALKNLTGGGAGLSLEDSAGNVLATGSGGAANVDSLIGGYVFAAAGTYYARVSGDQAATYSLLAIDNGTFDVEPNDTPATAQAVTLPAIVLGDAGHAGDSDLFSFPVAVGGTITIRTSTFADGPGEFVNTLDPSLQLYDPAGNLVASGSALADGRNEQIVYTAATGGTFYVAISAAGGTSGEYALGISATP